MHGNLVQVCLCRRDSKMEIPASDSFDVFQRAGFLLKLVGRNWISSGSWKNRYCVLSGSKLYFYENQDSKGSEKTSGVINLDYYDLCEEIQDKKNQNVFIIGTSVRGFFDNRHQFTADNSDDLECWIHAIQTAIANARLTRRKPSRKAKEDVQQNPSLPSTEGGDSLACLVTATKDRARGPQGRRLPQRKSMMPTAKSSEITEEMRMRSISLSSPLPEAMETAEGEDSAFGTEDSSSNDTKWLSQSLEEVDRDKARSNSSSEGGEDTHKPTPRKKIPGNSLFNQHAALTKELEAKLKIPPRKKVSESTSEESDSHRLESLSRQVESAAVSLSALELRVGTLTSKAETSSEEMGDLLLQVTVTLKEAERINGECKRALDGASKARAEYQALAQECRDTLSNMKPTTQQNGE